MESLRRSGGVVDDGEQCSVATKGEDLCGNERSSTTSCRSFRRELKKCVNAEEEFSFSARGRSGLEGGGIAFLRGPVHHR